VCFQTEYKLGLLITGKSHSRDESRNSRVSIETLDFAPVRNFTCVIGVGSPAWARRGRATGEAQRTTGREITASPSRRTPLDNRSTLRAVWARETAGSGRVSGPVAHLSKSRRAARRRVAIADRMLGVGDHRRSSNDLVHPIFWVVMKWSKVNTTAGR